MRTRFVISENSRGEKVKRFRIPSQDTTDHLNTFSTVSERRASYLRLPLSLLPFPSPVLPSLHNTHGLLLIQHHLFSEHRPVTRFLSLLAHPIHCYKVSATLSSPSGRSISSLTFPSRPQSHVPYISLHSFRLVVILLI